MLENERFVPFFGVVEDHDDTEAREEKKLGRVRVRCYGYHTDNKEFIPTDKLQWFIPVQNWGPSLNGLGETPFYINGTTVFGFFIDRELQDGIILGSLPGRPTPKTVVNMGFRDPDEIYPWYYMESDINRIARNENIEKTIVHYRKEHVLKAIPDAKEETWDEPDAPYDTVYPNNKVFETVSGHVIEYDDTPGAERISINHKSGTFNEYHPDGKRVEKVNDDAFSIFLGGNFIFVNGNMNSVVRGDHYHHVMGDYMVKVGGDVTWKVGGNINRRVDGIVHNQVKGNKIDQIEANFTLTVGQDINASAGSSMFWHPQGSFDISSTVNIGSSLNVSGTGTARDFVGGGVSLRSHKHAGVQSGMSSTLSPTGGGFGGGVNVGGSFQSVPSIDPLQQVTYDVEVVLFDPEIRKEGPEGETGEGTEE